MHDGISLGHPHIGCEAKKMGNPPVPSIHASITGHMPCPTKGAEEPFLNVPMSPKKHRKIMFPKTMKHQPMRDNIQYIMLRNT